MHDGCITVRIDLNVYIQSLRISYLVDVCFKCTWKCMNRLQYSVLQVRGRIHRKMVKNQCLAESTSF
jgi:hypothetical protein